MSDREKVTCEMHGETPATYVCRHVANGLACGFHTPDESNDDPWPEGWCDSCDELLEEAEGWSEEIVVASGLQLLCTHCYTVARDRNRVVPSLARGAAARLTPDEQQDLLHHAVHQAQAQQAQSDKQWHWIERDRWYYDDKSKTMTFSGKNRAPVLADVRLVGSYATASGTFQWAWALYSGLNPLVSGIWELQTFGEIRGILRLTTPWWECAQDEAWEMTSLAAYLTNAAGMYRAPFDELYWFMLLDNWRVMH